MAGKHPGSPKTGGRQKGTPNKSSQEFTDLYDEYAEQHDDPMLTLFEIQGNEELEPSLRARAAVGLLPYRYPKRKGIELTMEDRRVPYTPLGESRQRIRELLEQHSTEDTDSTE
tara:strand:+ start:149 stop:490 length:342 start_codon:yes stop_codon:yes gene_type:complete